MSRLEAEYTREREAAEAEATRLADRRSAEDASALRARQLEEASLCFRELAPEQAAAAGVGLLDEEEQRREGGGGGGSAVSSLGDMKAIVARERAELQKKLEAEREQFRAQMAAQHVKALAALEAAQTAQMDKEKAAAEEDMKRVRPSPVQLG
jgi:hypothetical protein